MTHKAEMLKQVQHDTQGRDAETSSA
jgi:hypothetical protein